MTPAERHTDLMTRHWFQMHAVAMQTLMDYDDAMDACVRVYSKLASQDFRRIKHLREDAWPWLSVVVRRMALDVLSERRLQMVPGDVQNAVQEDDDEPDYQRLEDAIQSLPETDRVLIAHRYWLGSSARTAATRVGLRVSDVYRRLANAKRELRTIL